ncbi:MAG: Fur family transcriptional regulator [Bacillota bacterium]
MNLNQVLAGFKEKGLKLTPQRQQILRVLLKAGGPLTAKEIAELVHKSFPNVGLGTVYRTLDTLREFGLLDEILFPDGGKRFELHRKHRHHLICLGCGQAVAFPFCPADCLVKVAEQNPDFDVRGHTFAVFGYCGECRKVQRSGG